MASVAVFHASWSALMTRPVLLPAQQALPLSLSRYWVVTQTSVRAGVLSTTGQSTNFVLNISLPIVQGTTPKDWVLQGVAALCMLDD